MKYFDLINKFKNKKNTSDVIIKLLTRAPYFNSFSQNASSFSAAAKCNKVRPSTVFAV
jgi:hypothetical protein